MPPRQTHTHTHARYRHRATARQQQLGGQPITNNLRRILYLRSPHLLRHSWQRRDKHSGHKGCPPPLLLFLSLSSCEHLTLTLPSLQTPTTRTCSGTATPVPCLTNHFSTWALQSISNWEGKHGALMLHELGDKGQFFPSIIPVLYKSYKRQEKPLQWGLFMNACGIWFVQNALFWVSTTSYCQQEKKFSNWSSNESIYLVTSVTNSLCSNHYFKSFHMLGSNNYLPSITSWGQ